MSVHPLPITASAEARLAAIHGKLAPFGLTPEPSIAASLVEGDLSARLAYIVAGAMRSQASTPDHLLLLADALLELDDDLVAAGVSPTHLLLLQIADLRGTLHNEARYRAARP